MRARAGRALLRFRLPAQSPYQGTSGGCAECRGWFWDCLAGALTTVVCGRCAEKTGLQVYDPQSEARSQYEGLGGYRKFEEGSLINIKVRQNDQIPEGYQPHIGISEDTELDINDQLTAVW